MNPPASATHPRRLKLLVLLLVLLVAWNVLRLGQALFFWKTLQEYRSIPGPAFLAAVSIFWAVAAFVIVVGLWLGKRWSWYAALGFTLSYSLWIWYNRLILQSGRTGWVFLLFLNLVFISLFASILFSRQVTSHFHIKKRKYNEPQSPSSEDR